MAQVMVNFRMDETVKKNMEQACREMGLSMTTAFTIFATKVGREKRIPFEITAEPGPARCGQAVPPEARRKYGEDPFARERERGEALCAGLRRSLTGIHTAIPASITGISMERIRLLCGDELKDKTAGVSRALRSLFSDGSAEALREKDLSLLTEYMDRLAAIAEDIRDVEGTLVPAMRAWSGGDAGCFAAYERRLSALSQDLDGLRPLMERFLASTSRRCGGARAVQARIRQAAATVETPYVQTALENLEALVLRHYDGLEDSAKAHLESFYLRTLELTLEELVRAERDGGDAGAKAALCLRAVNVVSQVISESRRAREEQDGRSLEAEVAALERLAAMRGDVAGGLRMDA